MSPRSSLVAAIAWRYLCHCVMLGLCVLNEARPGPSLHDSVLALVPRNEWISAHNYHLWIVAYVPIGLALWHQNPKRFIRFMYLGGWLSLLRGVCVGLTGLGPVDGPDLNAGADHARLYSDWLALINPVSALTTNAPHLNLTKDLFFSAHTCSTFLLFLYCRNLPRLGPLALAAHVVTVAVVFLAHLHYSIDVVGAWAITWASFLFYEGATSASDR